MTHYDRSTSVTGAGATPAPAINAVQVLRILCEVDNALNLTPQQRLCPKGLCVFLGELGPASRPISEWTRKHDATLMVINEQPLSLDWLRRYAPQLDFVMVDADYLGDTGETIDFCMQVRRALPSLPLILLSSEVRGHDLTCERMMACDVTLKSPVHGHMLTQGVQAAYVNNAYFTSERC